MEEPTVNVETDAAAPDATKPGVAPGGAKEDLKALPLPDLQEKLQASPARRELAPPAPPTRRPPLC